jgi:hypothetical protein
MSIFIVLCLLDVCRLDILFDRMYVDRDRGSTGTIDIGDKLGLARSLQLIRLHRRYVVLIIGSLGTKDLRPRPPYRHR